MYGYDTGFHEVADRVWLARYEWYDVNITVVGGDDGLLMIDTHSSDRAARGVVQDLRRAGLGEVVAVVNTHEHFDHTFGNTALRDLYGPVPIYATAVAAANTVPSAARFKETFALSPVSGASGTTGADPRTPEVLATEVTVADHPFEDRTEVDLGGRTVTLSHPGRGHTAGDLVVVVPDASLVHVGDLLEQTAPPVYSQDSYPLDWPETIDRVLTGIGPGTCVLPGHGLPVTREWVEAQRDDLRQVADTIRGLVADGVPEERAAAAGRWPWPVDDWRFTGAIARGYAQARGALR